VTVVAAATTSVTPIEGGTMISRVTARLFAFVLSILLIGPLLLAGTASGQGLPDHYVLPGDRVFPEGIAVRDGSTEFFVSSFTTGTIYRGQLHQPITEVFLEGGVDGRNSAVGLAVDTKRNRLYIAEGFAGGFPPSFQAFPKIWSYDLKSGERIATATAVGGLMINDLAIGLDGSVYATDSFAPAIYRMEADTFGEVALEPWLNLAGSPIVYGPGFNLNGIVVTPDGKYLLIVQSNTGQLFRVGISDGSIVEVDLGGAKLINGDGLVLRGHTLHVVRNADNQIDRVQLSGRWTSGEVRGSATDPSFHYPTTADFLGGRLLVVNAQFDRLGTEPDLPFTVSSVPMRQLHGPSPTD
jgi:DNA-binding beta-propeller fold protein YncE